MELGLFVYGTLKRGEVNHQTFCGGALEHAAALTRGRLFALRAGYPALAPSADMLLADTTGDPTADFALQRHWNQWLAAQEAPAGSDELSGGWPDVVHGEWLSFPDPAQRLPRIDRFEGCRPAGGGLFERRLIRIWTLDDGQPRAAWAYVQSAPSGRWLQSGRWSG